MILRPFTLLSLVAFLGAGLHVYQTKHEAALLDSELRSIARQVRDAEARSQTLQAEWAWLNQPQRLRAVAQRHLPELEAMQPAQFIRASEAERRLPAVVAYAGPVALFAAQEATAPEVSTALALVPRATDAVQVAAAPVAVAPTPVPVPAPVVLAETVPVAEPEPVVTIVLPAALPPVVAAAKAQPAPVAASRAVQPRPAPRMAANVAPPPPVSAPAPRRMVTQVAATVEPRPVAAPAPDLGAPRRTIQGFGVQSFAAGSALGGGRPMLAPPVPFGSAGAATLGGRAPTQ